MAKNQANILIQFIGNSHLLYAMTIYNKTKYHGGDADAILLFISKSKECLKTVIVVVRVQE
jgi:hypothetical protein